MKKYVALGVMVAILAGMWTMSRCQLSPADKHLFFQPHVQKPTSRSLDTVRMYEQRRLWNEEGMRDRLYRHRLSKKLERELQAERKEQEAIKKRQEEVAQWLDRRQRGPGWEDDEDDF